MSRKRLSLAVALLLLVSSVPPYAVADDLEEWDKPDLSGLKTLTPIAAPEPVAAKSIPANLAQPGGADAPAQNPGTVSSDKAQIAQKLTPVPSPAGLPSIVPRPGEQPPPVVLKGGVSFVVPKGTPIKLKLATIPIPEIRQELRDEEGNLRPAQLGEKITAKVTEDMFIDDNKVIPEGTVFYGKVSKLIPPRHVGRPGHLELKFDHFTTPDGRSFAFKAEANNFKPSTAKTKLQGFGHIAAHAAGGAALGTLIAYQLFGMKGTIAMDGYNLAGGAAAGAIGGIAWALWRRGPQAVLEPGDEFSMSIDTDMLIPAATSPTPKKPPVSLPGLEIEVVKKKIFKDPLGGGRMIRLQLFIVNRTRQKLNSIDLFIEDELGNRFPVCPDIDDETETLFHIQPLCTTRVSVAFHADFHKLKHKLVWLDHSQRGHVLLEQSF